MSEFKLIPINLEWHEHQYQVNKARTYYSRIFNTETACNLGKLEWKIRRTRHEISETVYQAALQFFEAMKTDERF